MQDHIPKKQFILEFFGNFGHDLGDPKQTFTDNPMDILPFIEECAKQTKPAFISVQPRYKHHGVYGIEKIFYDFDYGIKTDNYTEKQIQMHRKKLVKEIKKLIYHLTKEGKIPLIVKTRKGFHIYIYFDKIYKIDGDDELWNEVYAILHARFLKWNKHKYIYVDSSSDSNIYIMSRIPMSIHQKSGQECIILDGNLKPTKIRSVNYYRGYGFRRMDLERAVEQAKINIEKRKEQAAKERIINKKNWEVEHGYVGKIRPCFQVRLDLGVMTHMQRRALLWELWYGGKRTLNAMLEFYSKINDYDGDKPQSKCRYNINRFIGLEEYKNSKPWRCETLREKGWCLLEDCPTYIKQKEGEKVTKTKRKKTK